MTYAEIRERILQGVIRQSTNPPSLDRIRAVIDASFFQINSDTSESFAIWESRRELLRADKTLTFSLSLSGSGVATLSEDVLKKYLEDGTFVVSGTSYTYRRWPDYIRSTDRRLGYWSNKGSTVEAKKPSTGAPLTGDATCTFICSPPIPTTENSTFVVPDDFLPDFINTAIQFILGQTMDAASQSA